jgi:hypothetical protein
MRTVPIRSEKTKGFGKACEGSEMFLYEKTGKTAKPPRPQTNISSPYNPVIPRQGAPQQSLPLFHWTGAVYERVLLKQCKPPDQRWEVQNHPPTRKRLACLSNNENSKEDLVC